MASRSVRLTHEGTIRNPSQVEDALDAHGFAASKLYNVALWTTQRIWSETGTIPEDDVLKAYLKTHECYAGLHSQSSQRVIEELAGAFSGWYAKRRNGDDRANPPGYRKRGDEHPRSTVTWKAAGFRLDTDHDQVRLSKGRTQKSSPRAREYILVEYELPPEIDLTADSLQEVRAVYKRGEWRIQFVCTHEPAAEPPGEETAGVDLGIVNVAAVSYSTGDTELYPGHALREDEYYLQKELARCTDSTSRRATRLQETRSGRRAHYLHTITTDIIDTCVDRGVGELFVGDLHGIRDEDDPDTNQRVAVDWGPQGNLDLHSWPFAKIVTMLKYKGALEGITVTEVDERDTSRTCSVCGTASDAQRVQRGLYRCRDCETVANSDVAGAENIRLVGLDRFPRTSDSLPTDRSTGCLAQPVVNLFRRGEHVPSSGQGTLVQPASIG